MCTGKRQERNNGQMAWGTRLEKLWVTGTHLHSRAATVGNCLACAAFAILTALPGVLLHLCFLTHSVEVHRQLELLGVALTTTQK